MNYKKYDNEIKRILDAIHVLIEANKDTNFVKQIPLIETFKDAGFLSTVSLMGEIGSFSKPKQLFAHFSSNLIVRQTSKFEGIKI